MANMTLPVGVPLTMLLSQRVDEPLPNIAAFDTLDRTAKAPQVIELNEWIEPQRTCTIIMKHHGPEGLQRVLAGIARASVKHNVRMMPRVRAIAEYLGIA